MPSAELLKEADRQMTVCNACRYCEGYCAVFPAMELRRSFTKSDLSYLANLCFDCRDCYYACQYAPPHEFAINVPKVFAELRANTYRDYGWPAIVSRLFEHNIRAVSVVAGAAVAIIFLLVLNFQGPATLFGRHVGQGSFYRVVPYLAMTAPFVAMALYGLAVLLLGCFRFWRDTGGSPAEMADLRALWRATQDAFGLSYLKGAGAGCNYPDASFSNARLWLHHFVFYGFLLDFAATTIAAFYDHVMGWVAPYPLLSWPVALGTLGGIGLLIGTSGLLYLKWRSDREPAAKRMVTMDVAFLALLFLTAASGMLLLALRESPAMGTLLVVHLGLVAGVFLTAPYGKFAHVVYRYAALVRNSIEQARAAPSGNPS
jgi:citrate/tricarballylate utilization protein